MERLKQWRFVILVIGELSRKYKKLLLLGFLLGLTGALVANAVFRSFTKQWFAPWQRIGIVGDLTPPQLPFSIQQILASGLVTVTESGLIAPALASNWEATESGRVYTFTLQEGLFWHDGKPIEAKDISYNIRDVTFEIVTPRVVRAVLQEPFAPFLTFVSKPIFKTGLSGFGPYRVRSLRLKGESVHYLLLEPVADLTLPLREYRFYQTEQAAISAYMLGDIDRIEDLTSVTQLATWKNTDVSGHSRYDRVVALYFNLRDPLLREKSVRHALGYAVPELPYERAYSPISKHSWGYSGALKIFTPRPQQAQKLLQDSGVWTQSARLTITTFSAYLPTAEHIAAAWSSAGIPTNVQVVNEISSFQVLLSAQPIPLDPDQYPLWHSTQQTNLTGYKNVKVDKLLEDGRKELDLENRKKIYADFARYLVDDAPAIFLYYPTTYSVTRVK